MSKISGQFLISGQFQDICEISGISGQLGALILQNFGIGDTCPYGHESNVLLKFIKCLY